MKKTKITVLDSGLSDKGTQILLGVMKVKDAANHFTSDIFAKERGRAGKGGYQRKPKETRISQISNKVSANYYIPGAMITCYRDPQKKVTFTNGVGQFELDDDLYWMDGQTRMQGYLRVYNDPEKYGVDKHEFGEKKLNIIIFLGADIKEEANQFFDINQFAKSVPPGNRIELAAFLREGEKTLEDVLVDITWEIQDDPIWKDVITFPNEPDLLLPNSSFVTSLAKVFKADNLARIQKKDDIKKLLSAVWGGLQMALPEAFKSKQQYSLQRAIGVNMIHFQLPKILFDIQMKNAEQFDKDKFLDYFDPKVWYQYWEKLQTFQDTNREEKSVKGHEVWLRGQDGAVGKYSSASGRDMLQKMISNHLGVQVRSDDE